MSKIEILEYQPCWPREFQEIKDKLSMLLGALAVQIDHIGSTAVPELAAKDIIDIQVSVKALDDPKIIELMVAAGYVFKEEINQDNLVGYQAGDSELMKLYFREAEGGRAAHIHVREIGRVNQQYPLLFRDFLRENEEIKQAYDKVKYELAQRFANDIEAYYAIKDPYMDTLFYAANLLKKKSDN
ncbi:GrpB family protein [Pseudoalteromonas luteoviolacea]|uniref:GrpB family protein n=1 Tax=Pseudoalteromonas luteoviolacea TaxID=43657 RepID=UPI001B37E367|nr:GrpB family protein [Pseudoalteromonas luteoviolacea]